MVSKKTQSTKLENADVKKDAEAKVVDIKKKATTKTVAKKTTVKKAETKKTARKNIKPTEVVENPVLQKENVDNMATVLAVKAENENKKAVKVAKKEAKASTKKVAVTSEKVEELGKKATPARTKREAVKENVKKAQTKKFVEQKQETKSCCCCKGKDFFASWARAYKNIFKYKSRTSRYEAWAFMLLNSIVSSILFFAAIATLTPALIEDNVSTFNAFYAWFVLLFLLAQVFVYLSLMVRRLHDTGFSAWKGFFRPLTYSTVATIVLSLLFAKYVNVGGNLTAENYLSTHVTNLVLAVSTFVAVLTWMYYALKTFLVSFFYEENKNGTTYGVAMYCSDCYKNMGIRYMVLYFIYSSFSYSMLNAYIMTIANM